MSMNISMSFCFCFCMLRLGPLKFLLKNRLFKRVRKIVNYIKILGRKAKKHKEET